MRADPVKTGFAPVHNGQLYYEVAGSGKPVLLIHAGVADHTMWDSQFRLFSRQYRVIRYDARGYGKSVTQTTEFSNRQDILDLFNHLGVEKAAVIGISRGGQIAIDFTLENPGRVYALVTVAAGIGGFEYTSDESEASKREFELFSHMDELFEKAAYDELADLEAHAWADGPSQPYGRAPSHIHDYIHQIVRTNYTRPDGKPTAIPLEPPAFNRLGEIHVPTLVLIGEYDELVTIAMADALEKRIPGARKVAFPGTAHMIPLELPDAFNHAVLNFLQEIA